MNIRAVSLVSLAATSALLMTSFPAHGQVPVHKHYDDSEAAGKPSASGAMAPRLQNVGTHKFAAVTSCSDKAMPFMHQGINLTFGFNHAEAGRAFAEAARLDPSCAMAFWGQALVLGPNINAPMAPEEEPKALDLVKRAAGLKSKASPAERDYIDALTARYTGKADDRRAADQAFAGAMRALHQKYPQDQDAATIYAEALMDLRPWNYWTRDGQPYTETPEIIAALDGVIKANPVHPGALHYWIHLWEGSKTPEAAEAAADRLMPLAPAAGHLVHMPGHLFQRVGRYSDAEKANQLAIAADEDYITQCKAQGIYPLAYYPHNVHFLWFASTMNGNSKLAIQSARKTAQSVPDAAVKEVPILQSFKLVPDYALVRFGKWDEVLALPAPYDSLFAKGVRHYSRGMAYTRKADYTAAKNELASLQKIAVDPQLIATPSSMSLNLADSVLNIAVEVLSGELDAAQKKYDSAIAHLDRAVRYHDALIYTEPDDWHYPVRHSLGAVLIEAGRAGEAETIYWEDLRRNPQNGWALFGLAQALRAQGKNDEAKEIDAQFRKAWTSADVTLTASRF